MLTVERIRELVTKVGKKYGIKSAYLFGSYARGDTTKTSDVDIIIESGKIKTLIDLSGFQLDLTDELGTDVDVVTTGSVSRRFYDLIKNDRILLYES